MAASVELTVVEGACPLGADEVTRIVRAALAHGNASGLRIGVVMAPDSLMVELHGQFLDDPTTTDVITFDLRGAEAELDMPGDLPAELVEELEQGLDGELYVGVEEAARVAEQRGVTFERELALYVVHGVLHLCGWDDHTPEDAGRMRIAEHAVMDALGYPPDTGPHHS